MRIPVGDNLACLNRFEVLFLENRTVRQLVPLALTAGFDLSHRNLTGSGNSNQVAIRLLDSLEVMQADGARVFHLDTINRSCPRGSAANVESPHGQLRTRLTNRLGGNYANSLTDVDQVTTAKIPAVTLTADAIASLTTDR